MQNFLLSFIQSAISLFAIVDPIGGLPVFLSLTRGASDEERRRVFRIAVLTAFLFIMGFALAGSAVMKHVFHIGISEFTFAGGLLLVVVGIREMLVSQAKNGVEENNSKARKDHLHALAVSPIACPLLAGPGTIVTVILIQGKYGLWLAVASCVTVFSLTMAILHWAGSISRLMGTLGMLAVSRIMQIFIIAIGVRFMFMGLAEAFPRLFGN